MTKKDVEYLCDEIFKITDYTINDDLSIDVDGDVGLNGYGLFELPLNFRKVTGYFDCLNNQLTTLKGAPIEVGGHFDANNNYLTNLDHFPKVVEEDVYVANNKLTSLKGLPKEINGNLYSSGNKITSLEGGPNKVFGTFTCAGNNLTDLKGCPEFIERDFSINKNNIGSFKYGPKEVGNNIFCGYNNFLNLDDFEIKFGGTLHIEGGTPLGLILHKADNQLTDFFKKIKVVKGNELNIKRLQYLGTLFHLPTPNMTFIKNSYTIV